MPLSTSAPRQLMHNRAIECRGYQREDGLWDIEGHLVDTKTYPTPRATPAARASRASPCTICGCGSRSISTCSSTKPKP